MRVTITLGYTADHWRQGEMKFIPKGGKKSMSEPKSYRPISLTSFLFKALERLCLWELEREYLVENPLDSEQHAFTLKKNTDTAVSSVDNYIQKGISTDNMVLGLFLDISGAFDNVNLDAAFAELKRRKIPWWFTPWYKQYTKERKIKTCYCGESIDICIATGCPQGGYCLLCSGY